MLEIAVVFHPCSGHAVGTAAEEPGARAKSDRGWTVGGDAVQGYYAEYS